MLRFNCIDIMRIVRCKAFKYISCYGLIEIPESTVLAIPAFKYISCYGLIEAHNWSSEVLAEFKYISCYGLIGKHLLTPHVLQIQIHLMLRFNRLIFAVFHRRLIQIHLMLRFNNLKALFEVSASDSNTSHVTV